MSVQLKQVIYWGVGALALLALADPYPKLATALVIVLLVGVLLTHYQDYVGYFNLPKK